LRRPGAGGTLPTLPGRGDFDAREIKEASAVQVPGCIKGLKSDTNVANVRDLRTR
jgi:hypothetical protein